ncbi:methyl-accepting chemotaxis protein [uncultured Tateyamaria sp.]|uniref:methyl-accepting chemotaxis protein n=1 Tax=uncultured Tateyamaria sp. TaxID=455651 RepID=UPI002620C159|nr:methyl-accepting chemotaxis protein [uncultured Tateyamaria sp.]
MRFFGLSWFKLSKLNSVLVKAALIAGLMTLSVVITKSALNGSAKRDLISEAKTERATDVTALLAMQSGGAIKFGNEVAVSTTATGVVEAAQPDMLGALVMNTNGIILHESEGVDLQTPEALAMIQRAIESGTKVISDDGLMIAAPALFGNDNAVAGAVLTHWTSEHSISALREAEADSLLASAVVFLIAMLGNCFFLWFTMSRPLDQVGQAIDEVANKNYDLDIPHTGRGDEIGGIANRIEELRSRLKKVQGLQRDAAFKSAAFEGSSVPMMMVDDALRIKFVNPECVALLDSLMPDLAKDWPEAKPGGWIGLDLGALPAIAATAVQDDAADSDAGHEISLRVGERDIAVQINPAFDHKSRRIGAVIEWNDCTVELRNAAVLGGIDTSQMRLDFDSTGMCLSMNDVARERLSIGSGDELGQSLAQMMRTEQMDGVRGHEVASSAMSGEPVHGKIHLVAAGGEGVVVDGGFVPVRAQNGAVERIILLGSDVTDAEHEMRAAREKQARVTKEQNEVVAALGEALKRLSQGDLANDLGTAFPEEYEDLRANFNLAISSLREAVGSVSQNVESIRNETSEITTAADDLSRRTERQAATLEETAAALDELTSSVRSAADGADAASKMSADAQANAEQGGVVAGQAVKAMDEIKTSSQQISKITSVIDDIAFQTNLLALNAGVEAARAGEAGRGFAVVATEVRALAQRSSDAAREINTLISDSANQVQQGVDLVDRTGAALSAIVTSVSDISERVAEIASSAREQSAGLNEINVAVNELDHVTQQNAAMFEETTAASHALTSEADGLASAVAKFKLGDTYTSVERIKTPAQTTPDLPRAAPVPAVSGNAALAIEHTSPVSETGWEEF